MDLTTRLIKRNNSRKCSRHRYAASAAPIALNVCARKPKHRTQRLLSRRRHPFASARHRGHTCQARAATEKFWAISRGLSSNDALPEVSNGKASKKIWLLSRSEG